MTDVGLREKVQTVKDRRMSKRIERLEHDNERLKSENTALRKEFKDFRSVQGRMLKSLEDGPTIEVKKRRVGLIRMVVIAGGACVVGMRLGRERYEQVMSSARGRLAPLIERVKPRFPGEEGQGVVALPEAEEDTQPPETAVPAATAPRRKRGTTP